MRLGSLIGYLGGYCPILKKQIQGILINRLSFVKLNSCRGVARIFGGGGGAERRGGGGAEIPQRS